MRQTFSLSANAHIRRPQDFARVYDRGIRAGDAHLLLFAAPNGLDYSRFGLSVSRKKHGSAVSRNKKRRRLREAFRLQQYQLPKGLDFVMVPRQRDDSTLRDFERSIRSLSLRVAKKIPTPNECADEPNLDGPQGN